jgi:hypothetical protein
MDEEVMKDLMKLKLEQNRKLIDSHKGQWLPFGDLPDTHKQALIVYSFGCDVQWNTITEQDIKEFQEEEKERKGLYGIATISMKAATEECMRLLVDRTEKTFEEYHKWYINYDPKDERFVFHKEMWPVILSPFPDEWLQDGWHRLHSYYAQKQKKIPVLMYPCERQI